MINLPVLSIASITGLAPRGGGGRCLGWCVYSGVFIIYVALCLEGGCVVVGVGAAGPSGLMGVAQLRTVGRNVKLPNSLDQSCLHLFLTRVR
jgi:hypothetical protein